MSALMRCCIALLFATGCAAIDTTAADRNYERGLRYQTQDMFVVSQTAWSCPTVPDAISGETCDGGTWVCPTIAAALAGTACEGGVMVKRNHVVRVIGSSAVAGAWPVAEYGPHGDLRKRYVAATAVDTMPDTRALAGYAEDVARRYPERIALDDLTVESLFAQSSSYRGRYLVLRQLSRKMTNKTFAAGRFTFTIEIPVTAGSHNLGLVQFELASSKLVDKFNAGERYYRCGPEYCDDFVIVAQLTDRTVERVDERGEARRVPVFAVRELGDRYGSYTSR